MRKLVLVLVCLMFCLLRVSASYSPAAFNTDEASDFTAHVSHFGLLKSGTTIPVLKGNFPGTTLDTKQWIKTLSNSATLTIADGMSRLQSGTNSAGSISLSSTRKGRFEAGQISVFQSGVRSGGCVASNTKIWGMRSADGQEGIYFKCNGATFQVVSKKGGTETAVSSGSFNGPGSHTPADTNNTYRIEYSAGRALFYSASGGKKVLLHSLVDTAEPLVNDLDLGIYYENTNSGNTTDTSMYIRGSSISVWGDLRRFNEGGALITADFGTEVSRGTVSGYDVITKFGRNGDIDTASGEDVWAGGGTYTGFNATGNENIEVFSSDVDDQGALEDSGTATGGTSTTLIDSGGDFVTDGVAVGDILVNDTKFAHGTITAVTSTTITVFRMDDGSTRIITNEPGDAYRVVDINDTGAALIRLGFLLDEDFVPQDPEYVILNGTTGVTVTGNFMRCSRAAVIAAGSSGQNEGTITIRQATTTANVFAQVPTSGQTTIGAYTVPAGKIALVKRIRVAMVRSNGSAGSATASANVRPKGQAWRSVRVFEISDSNSADFTQVGADTLFAGTDVKFTIDQVSDNNTIVDGAFEFFLIDAE